ncbi:MAG: hypothetical protein QW567_00455 [Candidatus Hadarchaeales archaeon]
MLRVNLKRWMKENWVYVTSWIAMGLLLLVLLIKKLGVDILFLIVPFLPYLMLSLGRMVKEVRG